MTRPNLDLSFTDRTFTRTLLFPGVTFEIQRYSKAVEVGPKACTINAYGSHEALRQLFGAIRGHVEVSAASEPVWWGCLWSVEIHIGKVVYSRTLEQMANDIDIQFLLQTINQQFSGDGASSTTGFSADADSVAEFGDIQKRLSGGNGSTAAAQARRSREIATRKNPRKDLQISGQDEKVYAVLTVKSWIETLAWLFYTNATGAAAGFEQNTVTTSEASQFLGRAHPASTHIVFTATQTISRTDGGLWSLSDTAPFNYIYFTGSSGGSNDKAYRITTVVSAGNNYKVTPNVTAHAEGPSITTHDVGTKIWQTFTLSSNHPFYASAIDIRLWRNGNPTDDVTVKLYTVSGGLPDTLLATGTILNAEIGTQADFHTAVLDTPTLLAYGTTYGILIERTGSESLDCFIVGVDTAVSYSGGSLKLYAGTTSGYVARPTNADLIFKVAGTVEITDQMTAIVAAAGQSLVTGTLIDDQAGLKTLPYQDGSLTALQVIRNLAAYGTTNGKRLLMKLTSARVLEIYEEPAYGTPADIQVDIDGLARMSDGPGTPVPAYKCFYGCWVLFEPLIFYANDEKYDFIDEAEYNAANNTWRVTRWRDGDALLDIMRFTE